ALVAAVLLDTGGSLDETWRVFQGDFTASRRRVEEQISLWRQSVRESDKQELVLS
ncbi:unnamed protein product, partial [Effrenium voratum]